MTKYVVRYTVEAQEDLKSIYAYIAFHLKERATAQKLVNEIRKEIRSLDVMPERYTRVDWEPWASEGMRKFPVGNFVVYYMVDQTSHHVDVIRIFYGGRDVENILSEN
ncbi:MAG: type II toxin-antitoxin system RelE/ParE family toxin [Lachnospiraceae bacterium]|nr:type II toxin-antitoxin system RelE/ParE family toxin [Lachnospiraceae bacterium]MBQ2071401.1 type II toxin-antitoxin system RelE/ParE family toxin [Oscillospiraceae bacterium]